MPSEALCRGAGSAHQLLTKALLGELAQLVGGVPSHQNFQKPQAMENLLFLRELYVVPGVEHTRDVTLCYFGPRVWHLRKVY